MEVRRIFEKVSNKLYAVAYQQHETIFDFDDQLNRQLSEMDELERSFELWSNAAWLRGFFMEYRADLAAREFGMSVRQAVKIAANEARDFHSELVRIATTGTESDLMALFKPLDNLEKEIDPYELQMMKAKRPRSWIRLYALRYRQAYIITGGAIKLTTLMNRPHLQHELYKLRMVQKFLKEEENEKAFVYIEI